MTDSPRACHVLVTATSRVPSVELMAILPLRVLMQRGVCQFIYADETKVDASHIAWADVVLTVRSCSTRGQAVAQVAKAAGRKLVCFYDDDFLTLPPHSPSHDYYASGGIRRRLIWFLQEADVLCFSNAALAEAYGRLTRRPIALLEAGVEFPDVSPRPDDRVRVLFAGSIDHARFVDEVCREALRAAFEKHSDQVEVYCMGARPRFAGELPVRYLPYVYDYADYRRLVSVLAPNIGLAPLPAGDFFARKFQNKLLDYGSLGAAIIFSDVAPYRGVVEHDKMGLMADNSPRAWRESLLRLIEDSGLRQRVGEGALAYVREHHSPERAADSCGAALASFFAYRAPLAQESACVIPNRGLLREYLADHGMLRTARRGVRKLLGI
jgi:glycosyltransferase involved in cell wall biosynthesis